MQVNISFTVKMSLNLTGTTESVEMFYEKRLQISNRDNKEISFGDVNENPIKNLTGQVT